MVIDIHTHTFPEKIVAPTLERMRQKAHAPTFSDGTASGLSASMKKAGVDLSVILPVATNTKQVESINNHATKINETTGETGLFSFGCIHPDYEEWHRELARIAELGLKGIKIHPVYQNAEQDDPRFLRILDRAGELGLVVVAHTGVDIGYPEMTLSSTEKLLRAIRQVGPVKLVAAHMGGWKQWEEAEELLADTNIFLDTAFSTGYITPLNDGFYQPEDLKLLDEERFIRMVHAFGTNRILFGTDSPWSDQQKSVEWIRNLPLTGKEKDDILGENARRLLEI